jgi:hypothetical protein
MAEPVKVSIPHSLGKAEAMRRLESGLKGIPTNSVLALEQQPWIDNKLPFVVRALGQSIPGSMQVDDDAVRIEVMLPALLRKLWEPLKDQLLGRAKVLLEKK